MKKPLFKQLFLATVTACALLTTAACTTTEGTSARQTPGAYMSDAALTASVKAALLREPGVKVTEVNVETFSGVVQLSGFVDSADMSQKAEAAAKKVEGVKAVRNDTRVKPRG